jgi:hypothetical protein
VPLPTGPSIVCMCGKIVMFGGEATGKVFGTNETYDPKIDSLQRGNEEIARSLRDPRRLRSRATMPAPIRVTWKVS